MSITFSKVKQCMATFRLWLESIRTKYPKIFDGIAKFVEFAIPFIGCFAPALLTSTAFLMIGNFILFSTLLVLQWAILVNRSERTIAKLKDDYQNIIKTLNEESNENETTLEEMYVNDAVACANKFSSELVAQKDYTLMVANFSHLVSDKIKKITAEFIPPVDRRITQRVTVFLQESLNSLEDLLSKHYDVEIRTSIKLSFDERVLKTYARGKNNIISRGGELKVIELNDTPIPVTNNYAYNAIFNKDLTFFAEGNLLDMHNKLKDGDVFFCEYGDKYIDIFFATVIMPIRVPIFTQGKKKQKIYGVLCIDSLNEIPKWSNDQFRNSVEYHVIADYADSLAILIKEYSESLA